MSGQRYPEEFKIEAVKQVPPQRGHSVADVAELLDVTSHSIYNWMKKYGLNATEHKAKNDGTAKIRQLEKELRLVTEERDILKKPRYTSRVSPTEVCLYQGQQTRNANAAFMSAI